MESLESVCENEVGELDEMLHIPRIYDEPGINHQMDMVEKVLPVEVMPLIQQGRPLRLEIGNPDDLESLRWVDDGSILTGLGDEDVCIEVKAHGVTPM